VAGTKQASGPVVATAFEAPDDRQLIFIVAIVYPVENPQIEKRALAESFH
jgi:hypothetical protein